VVKYTEYANFYRKKTDQLWSEDLALAVVKVDVRDPNFNEEEFAKISIPRLDCYTADTVEFDNKGEVISTMATGAVTIAGYP